jgi:hypothetical protein
LKDLKELDTGKEKQVRLPKVRSYFCHRKKKRRRPKVNS